jgi:3-methyl-2-oxobutanoate hydroxymethyltransferase
MKHNLRTIESLVKNNEILTWLTCYDYSFATILEETDLDLILVGDSGGMVLHGYKDTVPVTMEEMISMCKSVRRGSPNKFVVGDMPKGSYEISNEVAVINAMRFVKEAGCDAIKLEGGIDVVERVKAIKKSGIAVIGHIGLTPQSSTNLGGYRVVGRTKSEEEDLISNAKHLEQAGVFAILVEAVPPSITKKIKSNTKSLIFGIGAGPYAHGQLLILHDLLGLYSDFRPKFAKSFIKDVIENYYQDYKNLEMNFKTDGIRHLSKLAIEEFIKQVKSGEFPDKKFSYTE